MRILPAFSTFAAPLLSLEVGQPYAKNKTEKTQNDTSSTSVGKLKKILSAVVGQPSANNKIAKIDNDTSSSMKRLEKELSVLLAQLKALLIDLFSLRKTGKKEDAEAFAKEIEEIAVALETVAKGIVADSKKLSEEIKKVCAEVRREILEYGPQRDISALNSSLEREQKILGELQVIIKKLESSSDAEESEDSVSDDLYDELRLDRMIIESRMLVVQGKFALAMTPSVSITNVACFA